MQFPNINQINVLHLVLVSKFVMFRQDFCPFGFGFTRSGSSFDESLIKFSINHPAFNQRLRFNEAPTLYPHGQQNSNKTNL